jgi:hypothetical protein
MLFTSAAFAALMASAVSAAPGVAPGSNPVKVPGKTWKMTDVTRYCVEDNSGCDYNFKITTDGKTQPCTIVRMPGKDAPTESWDRQKCADSDIYVSWGYSGGNYDTAFATITVNKGKELAWFGISNINGRESEQCGSDDYGDLPEQPVYTYN